MQQNVLAMFPGQGSQYVGMGQKLLDSFPYVKEVFEEAEDACQIHIRRLCFEGSEADLKLTANTQPCLLTVSVAYWKVLTAETGSALSTLQDTALENILHSLQPASSLWGVPLFSFEDAVKPCRRLFLPV